MTLPLTTFLTSALALIERDAPACYAALGSALDTLTVAVGVDGEVAAIAGDRRSVRPVHSISTSSIEVRCPRVALSALVEAELTLTDAVLSERVFVRAAPEHLSAFHTGWLAFVAGAARCPEFPDLLDRFLASGQGAGATISDFNAGKGAS